MLSPMKKSEFLDGVLFEIEEVIEASIVPDWADGQPLSHHTLLYIARGEGELAVNGHLLKLERESLHMHVPGTTLKLSVHASEPAQLYWVAFDMYRLSEKTEMKRGYIREFKFPIEGHIQIGGSQFKRLFYLLVALVKGNNQFMGQQYLHDMLEGLLLYAEPVILNDMEERLQLTIDHMQAHYREDIRINKLAEMAQLHPSYYSQVFKQGMGKSPISYLTQLRVNKAKEMLLTSDKSIRDIAADVGYRDEFYFSRRFKEASGYSPRFFTKKKDLKIISLSSAYTDHLFTLGLKPCAAQLHRHIPLFTKSLSLPEHAADPWGISREAFLSERPDLIVCKDNVLTKAKVHINDIAPIIAIPWISKDVYTHLLDIAELVNKKPDAVRWMDEHERKAEKVRKRIRLAIGAGTVAVCVCREQELRMYGARNIGHVFYRSLQLTPPERIQEQIEQHPAGTGYNWTAITPDELRDYDSDYLFFAVETESDRQRVRYWQKTNPAWMRHPAIRHKRVYFLDWDKWMVYAPFVIDQQLEEAERLLSQSPALLEYI